MPQVQLRESALVVYLNVNLNALQQRWRTANPRAPPRTPMTSLPPSTVSELVAEVRELLDLEHVPPVEGRHAAVVIAHGIDDLREHLGAAPAAADVDPATGARMAHSPSAQVMS